MTDTNHVPTMIALKKLNGVLVVAPNALGENGNAKAIAAALNRELIELGYIMNESLFESVTRLASVPAEANVLRARLVSAIREVTGAKGTWKPMYPNFPQQVMEASDYELFFNALLHYWSGGEWLPSYPLKPRKKNAEGTKLTTLTLITPEQFVSVFESIVSSRDSVSPEDLKFVEWFVENKAEMCAEVVSRPSNKPVVSFRETAAALGTLFVKKGVPLRGLVRGPNDLLRVAAGLSGGDVTLTEPTKFKSLPRKQRRLLLAELNDVCDVETMAAHRGKWVRFFHSVHVGEYGGQFPVLFEAAKKLRSREPISTPASRVETAIDEKDWLMAIDYASARPGDFVRRFDKLARHSPRNALLTLNGIVREAETRTLVSLLGHFKSRIAQPPNRVVIPKGINARPIKLGPHQPIDSETVAKARTLTQVELHNRFSKLPPLGKFWIDPALYNAPVPTQMRTASTSKMTLSRGTKVQLEPGKDTLRFFIYWVGQDIDLSASFHDENFKMKNHVSWTNLRQLGYSYHSGDIIQAPNGACEFIDIDLTKCPSRYVAMNVYVYSGPTFGEHEVCYAGWMAREKPNDGEVFDPKTVVQKSDVMTKARGAIPVVFDVSERTAIWTDYSIGESARGAYRYTRTGNTVESNRAEADDLLRAAVTTVQRKVTLGELLALHAGRGEVVRDKERAVRAFTLENMSPTTVNSEFMV